MTLQIDLPPEAEARLAEEAARAGREPAEHAAWVVVQHLMGAREALGPVREMVGGQPYEYYPLGQFIVAAPGVCGGEPTVKYTRIGAGFLLERLRSGETPEDLVAAYRGRVSRDAIEEALTLLAATERIHHGDTVGGSE